MNDTTRGPRRMSALETALLLVLDGLLLLTVLVLLWMQGTWR